jgi:hypothetical protein
MTDDTADARSARASLRILRKRDPLRTGPWLPGLGAIAFLAAGIFMLVTGSSWLLEYRRSATWPPVPAVVESIEREQLDQSWRIRCTYRFTYDGREYRSSRVSLTGQGSSGGKGEDADHFAKLEDLEKHAAAASPVTCFVNPADPTRSVLLRRFEWRMYLLPLSGLAFVLWGPILLFLYYRAIGSE